MIRTILLLLLLSCTSESTEQHVFLNELGTSKAHSFNLLMDSYGQFLQLNFPDYPTLGEQTTEFLNHILEDSEPLTFDSLMAVSVLTELENSGLRRDIYKYRNETYDLTYDIDQFLPAPESMDVDTYDVDDTFEDIISVDTTQLSEEQKLLNQRRVKKFEEYVNRRPYLNENGLFLYALSKAMKDDPSYLDYCKLRREGDISPTVLANGYLNYLSKQEYELWKNQIPLVVDIYLFTLLGRFGGKAAPDRVEQCEP